MSTDKNNQEESKKERKPLPARDITRQQCELFTLNDSGKKRKK